MRDDFAAFLRRLDLASDAEPESLERLETVGIDTFTTYSSDDLECGGAVDPRTGAIMRWATFAVAADRPDRYPTQWPFIPHAVATFTEAEAGEERVHSVVWPQPDNDDDVWRDAWEQLTASGWQHVPQSPVFDELSARFDDVVWFSQRGQWRSLVRGIQPGSLGGPVVGVMQRWLAVNHGDRHV